MASQAFVFVPPEGLQGNVALRPLPTSETVFPVSWPAAAGLVTTAPAFTFSGFEPAEMADRLSPRLHGDTLPAWHRVPKVAKQLPGGRSRGTIMKRAVSPYLRWKRYLGLRAGDHEGDEQPPVQRRRLHGGLGETSAAPEAFFATEEKESADFYSEAIVRVVDHFSECPGELFKLDPNNYRFGGLSSIVREKRQHHLDQVMTPTGSNYYYYDDLMNLIVDLWCHNGVSIEESDLVKRMYALQAKNNSTRQHLAAAGITDLSTIADVTEPDTIYEFRPPTNRATSLSAADRKARLSASMPTFGKSVSAMKESLPTIDPKDTSAPISPHKAGTYGLEYSSTSSGADTTVASVDADEIPATPAPRPSAPTPSRGHNSDPTTPAQVPQAAADTSAPKTPKVPGPWERSFRRSHHVIDTPPKCFKVMEENDDHTSTFSFADTSRDPSELIAEHEAFSPVKAANRRRSEPLLKTVLNQRASRASLSPRKFSAGVDRFNDSTSTNHASPARSQRSSLGGSSFIGNSSRPLDLFFPPRPSPSPFKQQKTPSTPDRYEIDCRKNPDIFGKKTPMRKHAPAQLLTSSPSEAAAANQDQSPAMTPAITNNAVKDLAALATNYCGSEAKVFVTKEDGRLKVRFKLPTKYATLFPAFQATETSHFSSELECSNSPPIRFPFPQQNRPRSPERMTPAQRAITRTTPRQLLTGSPLRAIASSMAGHLAATAEQAEAEMTDTFVTANDTTTHDPTMALDFVTASERREQFALDSFSTTLTPIQRPLQTPTHEVATPTFAPAITNDETLVISDFDASSKLMENDQSTAEAEEQQPDASLLDDTTLLTPTAQLQREIMNTPGSVPSELNFTPSFATPTTGNLDLTTPMASASVEHSTMSNHAQQEAPSQLPNELTFEPSFATPTIAIADETHSHINDEDYEDSAKFTPQTQQHITSDDAERAATGPTNMPQVTEAGTSTPLQSSFTPVNKPASQRKEVRASTSKASTTKAETPKSASSRKTLTPKAVKKEAPTPTSANSKPSVTKASASTSTTNQPSVTKASTPKSAEQQAQTTAANSAKDIDHYEEDRDYLRRFMKEARPKKPRPSTTETGSPVATTASSRPALGAKSPNASPSPRKRKTDEEHQQTGSPPTKKARKVAGAGPKAPKRPLMAAKTTTKAKKQTAPEIDPYEMVDEEMTTAEGPEQTEEAPRRSTRINRQPPESAVPKSSIPTPIKVGSRAGAGRNNSLTSVTRNEQVDLTRQTSQNTRRNKFKAESVHETLARVSEEFKSGSEDEAAEFKPKPSKRGNNVAWSTQLERHQELSPNKCKGKATIGKTGVTKPKATPAKTASTATAPKPRSQAAKKLGMGANGTPAKPATRARTRSQQ